MKCESVSKRRLTDTLSLPNRQRWSRGNKARGQGRGQGHKKNPRPRTAFPRTDTLEAKDRNARGQGQEPRTQAQVLSKKKRSSKNFSGDLHCPNATNIRRWAVPRYQSTAVLVTRYFFGTGTGTVGTFVVPVPPKNSKVPRYRTGTLVFLYFLVRILRTYH